MTSIPRIPMRTRSNPFRRSLRAARRPSTVTAALVGAIGLATSVWAPASGGAPQAKASATLAAVHRTPSADAGDPSGYRAGSPAAGAVAVHAGPGARPGSAAPAAGSSGKAATDAEASGLAASGIPQTALSAYRQAARREAARDPQCRLSWPLLAGIGRVESNHGRFAGAILHVNGVSTPPIIGIALNGKGTALIKDTDGGRLDGDTVYDRAVGPMQFIPSTWAGWGVDANADGARDPFNIFDAAAAAADYLCAAGGDLATARGQVQAILTYNDSQAYVELVMGVERIYADGVGLTVPVLPATGAAGRPAPNIAPADPGTPAGAREAVARAVTTTTSGAATPRSSAATRTSGGSSTSTSGPIPSSTAPDPSSSPPAPSSTAPDPSSSSPDPVTSTTASTCPSDTTAPPTQTPAPADPACPTSSASGSTAPADPSASGPSGP